MLHIRKGVLAAAFSVSLLALGATGVTAATPSDQLVIATSLAQVLSLDPAQGPDAKTLEILANLYDRLVAVDQNDGNAIVPQLAESWEVDDTGITFHLREANFTSGNPVRAQDVAYSLTRLVTMNQSAAGAFVNVGYTADTIGDLVTVIDDRTVRIELSDQVTAETLLYRLSSGPASVVDEAVVTQHVNANDHGNEWLRTNSAGSGAFTLNRWAPNDIVLLDANPDYWEGAPALRRVVMRHVPESQAVRLMLERGDVDVANVLTAGDIAVFDGREGFEIQRVQTGGYYVLSMNAGSGPLADPLVRQAIAHGIDYEAIAETIVGPYGRARNVPVPEDWAGAIENPDWGGNPERARELLAEAGYPDGFDLSLKVIAQTPRIDMATAIQADLAEIGIDVSIQQGNGADIVSAHRARDFELLIPQTGSFMPNAIGSMNNLVWNPDNSVEANNASNFVWRSDWDIPELTALYDELSIERDPERSLELTRQIQELFIESAPATLPMFERFEPIVLSTRVQGYYGHPQAIVRLNEVTKTD
jgi:peptide/nickel transport system substrate-binding protein